VTFVRRVPEYAWLLLVSAMVTTSVATLVLLMPAVGDSISSRDLARYFNRAGTLPARMVVLDDRIGSFVFYLVPRLRRGLTPARLASTSIYALRETIDGAPPDTIVAVRERRAALLEAAFAPCRPAYVDTGQFRLYRAGVLQECRR
jgi:hypothetical protein